MKIKQNSPSLLWKPQETAEFLRVPLRTIYDWVHKKKIPYHKVGRLLRKVFTKEHCSNFIEVKKIDSRRN